MVGSKADLTRGVGAVGGLQLLDPIHPKLDLAAPEHQLHGVGSAQLHIVALLRQHGVAAVDAAVDGEFSGIIGADVPVLRPIGPAGDHHTELGVLDGKRRDLDFKFIVLPGRVPGEDHEASGGVILGVDPIGLRPSAGVHCPARGVAIGKVVLKEDSADSSHIPAHQHRGIGSLAGFIGTSGVVEIEVTLRLQQSGVRRTAPVRLAGEGLIEDALGRDGCKVGAELGIADVSVGIVVNHIGLPIPNHQPRGGHIALVPAIRGAGFHQWRLHGSPIQAVVGQGVEQALAVGHRALFIAVAGVEHQILVVLARHGVLIDALLIGIAGKAQIALGENGLHIGEVYAVGGLGHTDAAAAVAVIHQ